MPKPLLIMDVKAIMNMVIKKKKKTTKPKKAAVKKAKAKKVKPVIDIRHSPFKVGDDIWYERTTDTWIKGVITKCVKPDLIEGYKHWSYEINKDESNHIYEECQIFPASIFKLIAIDVTRLRKAEFTDSLNAAFDAEALILAAYRVGQKRPWCYYVIPDLDSIMKVEHWKVNKWGGDYGYSKRLYQYPVEHLKGYFPVSSAPQEILTYLGLHLYNRKWKKDDQ